ncbi:SDR family oxidoreductase [Peteryoungia ipomoeae]|uniref:SDR family oxidoreductase n=1 Tax=Peteryoungia ipomoeae TaxID=1210932 RepID=A0A4S8P698_9HYPH|nr:SDR family oxidoreductase [Peteryoungia ipomoeae]THV24891.1 SDR family oxidoreductase [Peteryoungia ipomoeae]
MTILVLGATGFIGQEIVLSLQAAGHQTIGLGRNIRQVKARFPQAVFPRAHWQARDLTSLRDSASWLPLLDTVTAVINCAGALQDGLRDDLAVQTEAMLALQAAANRLPTKPLIVQISAPENLAAAGTRFIETKLEADRALKTSGLPHVILRPTVVVGRNAYGGTALLRAIASCPGILPLVDSDARLNAVHVSDVAKAVVDAVEGRLVDGSDLVVAGQPTRTLKEMARIYRGWLGLPEAPIVNIPTLLTRPLSWLADLAGRLGWRSPLRSTATRISGIGVAPAADAPTLWAPDPILRLSSEPAAAQDLWFARLYLLKPLMIVTLSLFWIASGVVPLFDPIQTSLRFGSSLPPTPALVVTIFTSLLDIALGLAVLVQPSARRALQGMILVPLSYLVGGTLIEPTLWLDPLGPLVKVFPSILLAVATLAVLEER